ncbi:MAG: peptidylprolyl isomerase [Flavobacteriaceae bacterium TMED212]|nr:MAG: peptidylprolyl isomerase [Flavobacteriaceae bacterium TMED212]|tara:strand:+ start:3413 stop:4837 length:1425 start_codon:yes stop_codon:yes gene_type:complete
MIFYKTPLNSKNLKNIRLLIISFLLTYISINTRSLNAQGTQDIKSKRIKVDGVSAVVGDYVILESDIDKTIVEMESQGMSTKNISRCELLGKLMEDKLYAHNAIQDSLEVSDQEIYDYVDQSIAYFTEQIGSIEKVLEFYKKPDELSFRDELFQINKVQKLSSMMQSKIVDEIEITPEEVRNFFKEIPTNELPTFGTELEISQIVIEPKVSKEEKERIINQLKSFKVDVEELGMSFASKAVLYSQDPGSRSSGGKYSLHRKKPRMVKEFRDIAFSMQEGQISDPFKTDFGWHILLVERIRGQEVDVRHILLTPKVDQEQLDEAKKLLDTLRTRIIDDEITFEEAALQFSNEKETRLNGGSIINPTTGDKRFELTKMDPVLYNQIRDLEDDEISVPLMEEDRSGLKKYKVLKVTNRYDEHIADYSKDYVKIKDLALKEKKLKAIKKWMEEKIELTYITMNKDFINCQFNNNWRKN